MSDKGWVVILGASSGFGAATARAFAQQGHPIFGVHLDRRVQAKQINQLVDELKGYGVEVHFENQNAASDQARADMVSKLKGVCGNRHVQVFMHSLAFGTLRPFIDANNAIGRRHLEMTMDVMANSLLYWVQDLISSDLLSNGGRIYAMTSSGSLSAWPSYGAVSAAKSALESHIRQLALELAPLGITANAIMAGVTQTPALDKIPGAEKIAQIAMERNPSGRLTTPEDVAAALVDLSGSGTYWMTGNVIRVDGGETISG